MQARRRSGALPVAGQVTSLELFFDLVFVFTITQLTATVLAGRLGGHRPVRAAAADPVVDVRRVRLADQRRTAGHRATPGAARARDDRQLRHRDGDPARLRRPTASSSPRATCSWWSCTPACTSPRPAGSPAAWSCSCSAGTCSARCSGWSARCSSRTSWCGGGSGRSWWRWCCPGSCRISSLNAPEDDGGPSFELVPGHFVERHGLMLLIALGESVLAIGVGTRHRHEAIGWQQIAFAAISLLLATTLYWAYFGVGEDHRAEAALDALLTRAGAGGRARVVRLCLLRDPLRDRAHRRRAPPRARAPDRGAHLGVRRQLCVGVGLFWVGLGLFRLALGCPGGGRGSSAAWCSAG